MSEKIMDEILDKVLTIHRLTKVLPYYLTHQINKLGLFVSVEKVDGGWAITVGGRWRPRLYAISSSPEGEWQVIRFDQSVWDRRFARLVEPTLEIAKYIFNHVKNKKTSPLPDDSLKKAVRHFKSTGEWPGLAVETEETNLLTLHERIRHMELQLAHEKGLEQFSRLAKRLKGGSHNVLPTLKQMDSVCGELQKLSYRLGKYETMQVDAIRTQRLKRLFPGLEPLTWINCYDSGLICLAALSYEVRGIGIVVWNDTPSAITGEDLGYDDIALLREMAIYELRNALAYLEMLPGYDMAIWEEVALALEAAQTTSAETFEKFNSHMQTILGYTPQPTVQHSSSFSQETGHPLPDMVGSNAEESVEDLRDEIKDAYLADTRSVERQRQLFEAGRYKEMELEVKRNLQSLMSNPMLPDSLQSPSYFLLGTLYLAALSHEVRGMGIPQWPSLTNPVKVASLGYEVEELRNLATDILHGLSFLELSSQNGPGGFGHLLNVQLAITCVGMMSVEAFEEFDNDYQRR